MPSGRFLRVGSPRDPLFFVTEIGPMCPVEPARHSNWKLQGKRAMTPAIGSLRADLEPRLVADQGTAARVAAIAEPVLGGIGYRLVRGKISRLDGRTVQITPERPDRTITVEACEVFSRPPLPSRDVAAPFDRA